MTPTQRLKPQMKLLGGALALMWAVFVVSVLSGGALLALGVIPRTSVGLRGILFAPFLHGSLAHIIANTIPFFVLGWLVMLRDSRHFLPVTVFAMIGSGFIAWLLGASGSVHIGASGVIFGYLGFLILSGWYARSLVSVLLSLLVIVLWGGMVIGVVPGRDGISWQAHLGGFLGGVFAARMFRLRRQNGSYDQEVPVRTYIIVGIAALGFAQGTSLSAQDTVRFKPTVAQPTFAVREPVLRIKPNTVLISNTNFGPYYTEKGGAFPGEVGPIYIEGATTKDMLVVKIRRLRPNHDLAASQLYSDFGGLSTESRVRFLNDPIPPRRYVWRIDRQRNTATTTLPDSRLKQVEIDLRPMLGRVAVAPAGQEAFDGIWPGDFGGNMDAPEVREGTTVYLPIFHDGAYFYFGDAHARQGHGEVAGTGLETSMDVVLELSLIKGKTIDWPRLEDENYIMVVGSARPLIDAFRLAHVELIEWMVEQYGFGKWDAYALVGQVAESTVANIVDPLYSVVAKFPKRFLPK